MSQGDGIVRVLLRGGAYDMDGTSWTIICGGDTSYGTSFGDVGFRVTLIPCDR